MKKIVGTLIFILPLLVFGQELITAVAKPSVSFYFVSKKVRGTLSDLECVVNIDKNDFSNSKVIGTAKVASLSTENDARDKHLKNEDFFDMENYPTMTFVSDRIEEKGEGMLAFGMLTIKETSKEVEFIVTVSKNAFIFTTEINAADYEVGPDGKHDNNVVQVTVTVPFE